MAKDKRQKKKEKVEDQSICIMMPTDDDWAPNYPDNEVRVTLLCGGSTRRKEGRKHMVHVWGADDDGMEFMTDNFRLATEVFLRIQYLEVLTHANLRAEGLERA